MSALPMAEGWFLAGTFLAMLLTFATLSFLYRDNPLYLLAQHLLIGLSLGYLVSVQFFAVLKPKLMDTLLFDSGAVAGFWYGLPVFLALLLLGRYTQRWRWLARIPTALVLGVFVGLAVQSTARGIVAPQIVASMHLPMVADVALQACFNEASGWWSRWRCQYGRALDHVLMLLVTLSVLMMFAYTKRPTAFTKPVRKVGSLCLMLGLGCSFGFAVSGRFAVGIDRAQDAVQAPWASILALIIVILGLLSWRAWQSASLRR